jgi:hypothetical protein
VINFPDYKEMQIKTRPRFNLTPVIMAIYPRSVTSTNATKEVAKQGHLFTAGGNIN